MDYILKELKNNPYIKLISNLSRGYPARFYLVGGFLRDLFLRRKKDTVDFDFAVSSSAIKLSHEIARRLKSPFVILDKEHGSTRIIYRDRNLSYNFDFTDFRGKDIIEDLSRRDFTINTLALDLKALKNAKRPDSILIDRYYARRDLKAKIIRVISEFSFTSDPLRILRAFSLSALLNFRIEKKTKFYIKKHKDRISSCAFERISEELFKILNSPNGFKIFKEMDDSEILAEVIPEIRAMYKVSQGPYHHLDVYGHSLETLKQIEGLFQELERNKDIQNYLNEVISGTHTRRALLKLGAYLHDIGKPVSKRRIGRKIYFHGHEKTGRDIVRRILERLRLSIEERARLDRIIFWHLRPGYLADIKDLSKRAIYRYFRDTQNEAVSILLLSIADQRSTRGPLTKGADRAHHEKVCLDLVKEFFRRSREKKLPKLLDGNELMRYLGISPGPLVGKVLDAINEAQAIGQLDTKSEALRFAKKFVRR